MPNQPLTKDQLVALLNEMADLLNNNGIRARFYIVGGAAMVLGYSAREMTRDIDAQYYPKEDVNQIAVALARKFHLPVDWLSDRAAMFISPAYDDTNVQTFLSVGMVTIEVASAEVLLAMKLRASRQRIDNFDIEFLCRHLEVSSQDQALDIFDRYYPEDNLPKSALPILRSIFEGDKGRSV